MADELKQVSDNLAYSNERHEELEETISTLEENLGDLSRSAEICNKELLRKQASIPLLYNSFRSMGLYNFPLHCPLQFR